MLLRDQARLQLDQFLLLAAITEGQQLHSRLVDEGRLHYVVQQTSLLTLPLVLQHVNWVFEVVEKLQHLVLASRVETGDHELPEPVEVLLVAE